MKGVFHNERATLSCLVGALLFAASNGAFAYEDVTPTQAYDMATTDPDVYILDVRTPAEWKWVGHPGMNGAGDGADLSGKVLNVSFKIEKKGSMIINPSFLSDVNEIFEDAPYIELITMCLSGGRSVAAATLLEGEGYNVLNMLTGFEGGKDTQGYRTVSGWKVDGLPYTYSGDGYED